MNKYRVIYYLCIIAFIANVSMMIGTLMGWFHILDSNYNVDPLMIRALAVLLFLSSIEISLLTVISYAFLAGWMGNESLEVVIKKSGYKILFFYIVAILLNNFGDQVLTATFGFGHALVQGLLGLF